MQTNPIHVLLVEDNPGDARLVCELVREEPDLRIHHVDRLAAGLSHLAAEHVDVVLLDLGLPDRQGLDTLRAVIQSGCTAPVVILTGRDDEALGRAAVREGAQDYLVKGHVAEYALTRAVRYAIERKRVERTERMRARWAEALLQLFRLPSTTETEIVAFAVKSLVTLTESKLCFVGFVNSSETSVSGHIGSQHAMDECAVVGGKPVQFDVAQGGLWTAPIRQHQAIVVNDDTAANPLEKGCPASHVPLTRFLGVPLIREGRTVLVAGLANKGEDFSAADQTETSLFLEGLWEVINRKRIEKALRESVKYLGASQQIAHLGHWHLNVATNEVIWSEELYRMHGLAPSLPPPPHTEHGKLFTPESWERLSTALANTRETGVAYELELVTLRKDGSNGWVWVRGEAELDPAGEIVGLWGAAQDITNRKRAETRERLVKDVLTVLNRPNNIKSIVRDILLLLKQQTCIEAVGIRLKEGEDFPYSQTNGFPDHFVESENQLCARDAGGRILRNAQGLPVLECMCGNVIGGRTNPALPFFTSAGSFWTNSTTDLLASTTETERQARTRNRCHGEGYESVALIPLKAGDETIGLLQLNDHRRNQFTLDRITFLEGLGASIGIAITRTRADEKQRESAQMIEAIINAIPVRVFWKDVQLAYLGCNAAFARDAGFADPKDLVGKDDFQMGWREQAESYRADDRAVIENGCSKLLFEETVTTPSEETLTLLTSKLPMLDSQGNVSGILGTYMDITERRRAEEVQAFLARSSGSTADESFFLTLARFLARNLEMDFVCIDRLEGDGLNARTVAVWCDGRFEDNVTHALKDTPCGEVVGKTVCCFPANVCEFFPRDEVLRDLRAESYVGATLFGHTGRPIGLIAVISRRPLANRRQVEAIVQTVGVRAAAELERVEAEEARQRLEEQLHASQKMEAIGSLAGGVAHDFNNLLSVILGHMEFALEGVREGDPLRDDLLEVKKAGERATVLTRQLLAFSRKQILQPVALDLNQIAAGVEKMLRRILGEDIDLVQALAPDLGLTLADPGQIEQVLMNLVVNARDAMPEGGKLTIETSNVEVDEEYTTRHVAVKPGSYVQLAISDTGSGMDGQTRARIFEPFFTTKEKGKGTGLGLSTVYGIVKQSGGDVWVYSEVGKGTTFKVYLPRELSATAATAVKPSAVQRVSKGTETILVVEDEDALRRVALRTLESAGYKVLTAADGDEALMKSAQHAGDIHLLLTDVVMPRMSGRVLAQEVGKTRPTVKVVYMSGYTDNAIVHHGVLDAGTHFLAKPFTSAGLTKKIREVLDEGIARVVGGRGPAAKGDDS